MVICGGLDQVDGRAVHDDLQEVAQLERACRTLGETAAAVVVFGPAGHRLKAMLPAALAARDLPEAFTLAFARARAGDTVLLAPMFPLSMAERVQFTALARRR